MKPSRLLAVALCAALSFLALTSSAQAPQKPAQPTPAQLQQRIEQLQKDLDQAKLDAKSAALDSDYIQRVQKQYESYYERVLNTQMWTLAIMGFILTAVFGLAALFSFRVFDNRINRATAEASTQLRSEITGTMNAELDILRKENASQNEELTRVLKGEMKSLDEQVEIRSDLGTSFVLALTFSVAKNLTAAAQSLRQAVRLYKKSKLHGNQEQASGVQMLDLLFASIKASDPQKFSELAAAEIQTNALLYDGLDDELAKAAITMPDLIPILRDRKKA